jgi:hypothetical protein
MDGATQKTFARLPLPVCPENMPSWLEQAGRFPESAKFDLTALLKDSLYYPSCEFDGTPIKHFSGLVHSFVYADYGVNKANFLKNLRGGTGLRGYCQVLDRDLMHQDLVPPGWQTPILPPRNKRRFLQDRQSRAEPFGHWSIWKRDPPFSKEHGPEFLSLLYLGAEMSATYQGLYLHQGIVPTAIALIQPGCMGGEWEYPTEAGSFFKQVVDAHPQGLPDYLIRGSYTNGFDGTASDWPEYQSEVCRIYERSATLWAHNKTPPP